MTAYYPIAARFIGGEHVGYTETRPSKADYLRAEREYQEEIKAMNERTSPTTTPLPLGPSFPQPDEDVVGLTPCDVERIFVTPSMFGSKDRKAWEARVTAGVRRALVEYENGKDVAHEKVAKAAECVMAFMDGMGS